MSRNIQSYKVFKALTETEKIYKSLSESTFDFKDLYPKETPSATYVKHRRVLEALSNLRQALKDLNRSIINDG